MTTLSNSNQLATPEEIRREASETGQGEGGLKGGYAYPDAADAAATAREGHLDVGDGCITSPDQKKKCDNKDIGMGNNNNTSAHDDGLPEGKEGGVLSALRVLLETPESASFFAATLLSGIAAGVIDTFLFIR